MLSFIGQIYSAGLEWNDAVIYGEVTRQRSHVSIFRGAFFRALS